VAAEGVVTRILLYLVEIFIFVAALLSLAVGQASGAPSEDPPASPEAASDAAPEAAVDTEREAAVDPASADPAPPAALAPVPDRTSPACPAGQCAIGRTNTVPPRLLCGPCPARTLRPISISTFCPKLPAPGAIVYLNDKPYGHGFDSTVRVKGDPEFCYLIHGVSINDCHLETWPKRVQCEMELMRGCPIWQYIADGTTVHGCYDDRTAAASCDHFGSVGHQDDPQTPTTGDTIWNLKGFEGLPLECGLQRNPFGPMAGFFTVAHGIGNVRACKPDGTGCGPWRAFNH